MPKHKRSKLQHRSKSARAIRKRNKKRNRSGHRGTVKVTKAELQIGKCAFVVIRKGKPPAQALRVCKNTKLRKLESKRYNTKQKKQWETFLRKAAGVQQRVMSEVMGQ